MIIDYNLDNSLDNNNAPAVSAVSQCVIKVCKTAGSVNDLLSL